MGFRRHHAPSGNLSIFTRRLGRLAVAYSLHDNPVVYGVSQGIMGSLFIIGMASIIGLKTKRLGVALTASILLAGLVTFIFANVQSTLVVDGDEIAVQKLYSVGYKLRKDDVMAMAQVRRRGGGTALVLMARNGQEYGILATGRRGEQLEEALAKELGLTAEPSFGDLKRRSRKTGA
jgi:hypothetical protein